MTYFVVSYSYRADNPRLDALLSQHDAYVRELASAGNIVAAGPLTDSAGGTLIIVKLPADTSAADTPAGVLELLADDPLIKAGVVTQRCVRRWEPAQL